MILQTRSSDRSSETQLAVAEEARSEMRPPNSGTIAAVHGSVVDALFENHLPPIHSLLRAGEGGKIIIEVLAQLNMRHVRGIALTPTQGLARGSAVTDTGGPLQCQND